MFAQRLAGHSAARITRAFERCPGAVPVRSGPGPDPHRTGAAWTLRTVAAILANPATRAGRCGTGGGLTSTWPTRLTAPWGIGRCSGGTCPRLGDLQVSGTCGAGQRGGFHRRLGHGRAARPGRPGGATAPAGRAAGVRAVRAQAGVSLVQRQAGLPVPPRPGTRSSIARTTIMEPGSAILTLTTWPANRPPPGGSVRAPGWCG
jgi:hypothetical protein